MKKEDTFCVRYGTSSQYFSTREDAESFVLHAAEEIVKNSEDHFETLLEQKAKAITFTALTLRNTTETHTWRIMQERG